MALVIPVYGIILENGGDTPRAASLITYKVEVTLPSGQVVQDDIQPHDQRPFEGPSGPDDPLTVHTLPLPVGSPFTAYLLGGEIQYLFREREAGAQCDTGAGLNSRVRRDAFGNVIPDDGGSGGDQGQHGQPGGGVGGGGVVAR